MRTRNKPAEHETMDDGSMGKKCNRCHTVKHLTEYSRNAAKWDSLSEFCRTCGVAYNRKNQDAIKEKNARFREKHHDKIKERVRLCVQRKRAQMAPGEMAKITREYRAKDPEKWRTLAAEYRKKDPERGRANARRYFKENKPKVNAYWRKRRREDPLHAITCRLRDRFRHLLRSKGVPKTEKALELVGCTKEELKAHLESKFTEGMTWDALMCGEIHIDHIKPLAKFDLSKEEERKAAFLFSNLQPLWGPDNFLKSDKWTEPSPDPSSE